MLNLSDDLKRIISNALSLLTLQGANYILPLIIIPYLLRVIGLDLFGLLAFSTAIVTYFLLITDYGFNLSATNNIALNKDNKEKINEIFSSVMLIKLSISMIGFILLLLLVTIIPKFQIHWDIYLYTYAMVIGQALIPLWLFQGMEKMKYMTYFNILAKVIATACIFIFVNTESDYIFVPIFTSLGFFIAGLGSLYISIKDFKINFYIPDRTTLIFYIKDGWHIFVNNIFVSLYTATNIVILGFFTNNIVVGYYSLAEKIIGAISGLFAPVTQAIYPFMTSVYKVNELRFKILFKKVVSFYLLINIFFCLILTYFNNEVILLLTGNINNDISDLLYILIFSLLLSPLGSLFTQTFIIKKQIKRFMIVVNITLLTNMILVFPLVYIYGATGLAITVVVRQFIHTILNIFYYVKK